MTVTLQRFTETCAFATLVACALLLLACGQEDDATENETAPPTVELSADYGAILSTGETLEDGSGFKVDLVAHKHGAGLDLKGGRVGTSYQPIEDFSQERFDALSDVPCGVPGPEAANNQIMSPEPGVGLTVLGHVSTGAYKIRVQAYTGSTITLEYALCPDDE